MIMIEIFILCKILSEETVVGTYTHFRMSVCCPDILIMVDWALITKYLSVYVKKNAL